MFLEPVLVIFYISLLLCSIVAIVYLYSRVLKERFQKPEVEDALSISKVLEQIENKTKDITDEAVKDAQSRLAQTELVKQDLLKQLDASFEQIEQGTVKLMNQKQQVLDQEYQDVIAQIRQEAAKAKEVLSSTELVKQDIVKEIGETIKKVGDRSIYYLQEETVQFDKQYKDSLSKVLETYIKKSEDTLKLLEKIPEDELSDFKNIMTKQTLESQTLMNKKVNEEYQKIRQELDQYKKEQIEKIEASLNKFILKVTEEVIGKSISLSDHEQIVLNALEEAKRENLFNP